MGNVAVRVRPGGQSGAADLEPVVVDGRYRLVATLATERPLVVLIADAQWSDVPSSRSLCYLARRLELLAVAAVVCLERGPTRSSGGLRTELRSAPGAQLLARRALGDVAVAGLLAADLRQWPDPGFARARANATAADAVALARAITVLGATACLPLAASLAGLDGLRAERALDLLAATDIVGDSQPLRLNDPIVHRAIYEGCPRGLRSALHRKAAAILASEGADLDAIAAQLMRSEPAGVPETVAMLRSAAVDAGAVGAPDRAVDYLSRALEEGPVRESRAQVLLELGEAERRLGLPSAGGRLAAARRLSADPVTRATAMVEEARLGLYRADPHPVVSLLDAAIDELGDRHEALRSRAQAMRGALTMSDPRRLCEFEADVKATRAAADSNRSGARAARALLWDWDSRQGAPARAVLARLDGCLHRDGEEMPAELVPNLVGALLAYELYDQAREAITDLQEWARASGSVPERALADGLHAFVQTRLGNLTTAETMLRSSIERTCELRLELTFAMISWYCADVLLERPDVADLTGLIDAARPEAFLPVQSGAMLMEARAQLRFAARQRSAAIHDMRTAGAIYDALGIKSLYGAATWRSTLAPMLDHADREEALELAQHGLEMARSVSQPRPIGVGLRVLGTLEQNCGRLSEAAAVLASLSAPLEHARALVELGAALRRQGQRAAAREPLRRGLDLATRCGAVRLAECARTELIATGARPRRDYATGRDALTPSERRVAEMAAQGLSSEAIAHELVVTTRTVDSHLSRAYRKLGIHSRKALADALKTAE